jgi:YesN/AraC family two-component response regulator
MRSERCCSVVKKELTKLGLSYRSVTIGEVELSENITDEKLQLLDNELRKSKLAIIRDNKTLLIEKTKEAINQLVNTSETLERPDFAEYISKTVNHDYLSLSRIFLEAEGITVGKYYIRQRINRAKDLLVNKKASLSEISYMLLYSSVAHLSNQFKKITGFTPQQFRQRREKRCAKSLSE